MDDFRVVVGTVDAFTGGMAGPFRILSVDNQASVTFSMKFVFTGPRYEVLSAESGEIALTRLEADANPYDLIIVDQKMPSLTGVELVAEIRRRGLPGEIMVISAHLSADVRAAFEEMRVRAIFTKPFDLGALRQAVERIAALPLVATANASQSAL